MTGINKIILMSFLIFAFHIGADLSAEQENDVKKEVPSEIRSIHFGPGPHIADNNQKKEEQHPSKTPRTIHFGPGPHLV